MFFSTDITGSAPPIIGNCSVDAITWVQNNKNNMDFVPASKSVNLTYNAGTGNVHPYTAASGVLRRSGNVITLAIENLSYNTAWVDAAAGDSIFTCPNGYRPLSNTMLYVFAKDEPSYCNIGIYINTSGQATWGWGKLPSQNYIGTAASLCISGCYITGDTMPIT
jgi:hypothetical protein